MTDSMTSDDILRRQNTVHNLLLDFGNGHQPELCDDFAKQQRNLSVISLYNHFNSSNNMSLLFILSYVGIVVHIIFVTVSIVAGLYYAAELVEEYSVVAKRVINWIILGTVVVYVTFIFTDKLPWSMLLCGLGAQLFHALIMKNFPFVEFLSVPFLGTVGMLFANHVFAFQYFTNNYHTFSEVLAYFTLCIWIVPFALFLSLSANDNVLPTVSEQSPLLDNRDVVSNYFSRRGKKQGLLSLFNYAKESLLPQRNKKSF